MHLIEKIQTRLADSQSRKKYIRKVFRFSSVDYEDAPYTLLEEIEEYISQHELKIDDFEFESYIDSDAMQTILILRMYPDDNISKYLQNNTNVDKIINCNTNIAIIRSGVKKILESFVFEINDEKTRSVIQHVVSDFISSVMTDFPEIRCVEKQNSIGIFVIYDNKEIPIMQYLQQIQNENTYYR